jgi:thiol:disulfide interchange protein
MNSTLKSAKRAQRDIEKAAAKGQKNVKKLGDTVVAATNQALGKPAKKKASSSWLVAFGVLALLIGLGLAIFAYRSNMMGYRLDVNSTAPDL